jgi:hypothetical protein
VLVKNKNMVEAQERTQSYQPMYELATSVAAEMGESADQRVDWLLKQDPTSFGGLLTRVNATARGLEPEQHGFDGEGVQAGTIGGSIPPDQEDKVIILGELLQGSQELAKQRLEQGEDPQTIMHEVAMAMPVVINKLHLFGDGNGRISRFMRMVLRDGDQLTPEKTELLISKDGFDKYDTTPAFPVERALPSAIRQENGTSTLALAEDLFSEADDLAYVEDEIDTIVQRYPNLDMGIVKAYEDGFNFAESMRLMAKASGAEGKVSLRGLVEGMADNPEAQQQFLQAYKGVRRQRAEVLMEGLLGKKDILLPEANKAEEVKKWTGSARQQKGLPELDPDKIRTIQDFQMAYMEAFSPERAAA